MQSSAVKILPLDNNNQNLVSEKPPYSDCEIEVIA